MAVEIPKPLPRQSSLNSPGRGLSARGLILFGLIAAACLAASCSAETEEDDFALIDATSQTDILPEADANDGREIEMPEGVAVPIDLREYLADATPAPAGS